MNDLRLVDEPDRPITVDLDAFSEELFVDRCKHRCFDNGEGVRTIGVVELGDEAMDQLGIDLNLVKLAEEAGVVEAVSFTEPPR
jgi:hypothetical protein